MRHVFNKFTLQFIDAFHPRSPASHSRSPSTICSNLKSVIRRMSSLEDAKKSAAYQAVDNEVPTSGVVGIGSGSTVVYAAQRLGQRVKNENLDIVCIPTSFQSEQLIHENGLRLGDLTRYPEIDVVIDGADEVDPKLTLIKGGGGCHLQEKIVASCTKKLIIVADHSKKSERLGTKWSKGVPIEVVPMACTPVMKKIVEMYKGEGSLRMAKMKAGPVVTDNGNFVIDWRFPVGVDHDWAKMDADIKMIPGVVETGLFVNMARKAYFGMENGSVEILKP